MFIYYLTLFWSLHRKSLLLVKKKSHQFVVFNIFKQQIEIISYNLHIRYLLVLTSLILQFGKTEISSLRKGRSNIRFQMHLDRKLSASKSFLVITFQTKNKLCHLRNRHQCPCDKYNVTQSYKILYLKNNFLYI